MRCILLLLVAFTFQDIYAGNDSIRCNVSSGEEVGHFFSISMLSSLVFKLETSVVNEDLFLIATEVDGDKVKLYFESENEKQKIVMFPSREMTMDDRNFEAVFKLESGPFKDYFNVTCYR